MKVVVTNMKKKAKPVDVIRAFSEADLFWNRSKHFHHPHFAG